MVTIHIPIGVLTSIQRIIDMYIPVEEKHYEEQLATLKEGLKNPDEHKIILAMHSHIYHDLELVNRFMHSQDLEADIIQAIKDTPDDVETEEEAFDREIDYDPDNIDAYLHEEDGGDK